MPVLVSLFPARTLVLPKPGQQANQVTFLDGESVLATSKTCHCWECLVYESASWQNTAFSLQTAEAFSPKESYCAELIRGLCKQSELHALSLHPCRKRNLPTASNRYRYGKMPLNSPLAGNVKRLRYGGDSYYKKFVCVLRFMRSMWWF